MATQSFQDTIFEGRLTARVALALPWCDAREPSPNCSAKAQMYFYETVDSPPQRLKIAAPRIAFKWYARATGRETPSWKAGLLQSISHAAWTACYSNGKTLQYRLNSERGLVRDGKVDAYPFYGEVETLPAGGPGFPVFDGDGPGVTLVTEYPGTLFDHCQAGSDGAGSLVRTEGSVRFATFLAVRDTQSGAVVTLGELEWALSWDGTYDFANKRWTPADPAAVVVITRVDQEVARVFPDPAVVELPFSLGQEVANGNHQILTPEGWVLCQEGLPIRSAMLHPKAE
jgi:hypothetical protein